MTEEEREDYYFKQQLRWEAGQAGLGPQNITAHYPPLYMRAGCEEISPDAVTIPPIASELWESVNGKYIEDEYQKSIDFQTRLLADYGLDEEPQHPAKYSSIYLPRSRDNAELIDQAKERGKEACSHDVFRSVMEQARDSHLELPMTKRETIKRYLLYGFAGSTFSCPPWRDIQQIVMFKHMVDIIHGRHPWSSPNLLKLTWNLKHNRETRRQGRSNDVRNLGNEFNLGYH